MKKSTRRKTRIDALLKESETPVFLLDDRRRVLFFNTGCERLTGWTAEEIVGCTCDYADEPDAAKIESLTGNICPPPEVFSGKAVGMTAQIVRRDGETFSRVLNFFALTGERGRAAAVLGVITQRGERPPAIETTPAQALHAQLAALRSRLWRQFSAESLVCRSEPMLRVLEQVQVARSSMAPLLLEGEAGTGKEHVARVIHSRRNEGAFVPLDCRQMKAIDLKLTLLRLLKSGRHGDEENGATPSLFEPRTVYLAYVDSLPRDIQELLVDAFQAGRDGERPALRIMSASTADPQQALAADAMRSDFFYLATAIHIKLPPLRRRPEDLPLLAQSMLEALNRGNAKQVAGFAADVWNKFREYSWPGNLDELRAVVEEARAACQGELIQTTHLPFRFRAGLDAQSVGPKITPPSKPLEEQLKEFESAQIRQALQQAEHNKTKAARLLGMTRPRLYRRMQALGIADVEPSG